MPFSTRRSWVVIVTITRVSTPIVNSRFRLVCMILVLLQSVRCSCDKLAWKRRRKLLVSVACSNLWHVIYVLQKGHQPELARISVDAVCSRSLLVLVSCQWILHPLIPPLLPILYSYSLRHH
mmetsp:Transcript_9424/g.24231  ORF Transcript_9424/g.24231 Transcript_9424/m.24231 type:complete len:122 (-) Transcript_9424:1886-2251(-)